MPYADRKAETLEQTWRGTVLFSPFVSPGAKEIAHAVMEQEYGSLILTRNRCLQMNRWVEDICANNGAPQ